MRRPGLSLVMVAAAVVAVGLGLLALNSRKAVVFSSETYVNFSVRDFGAPGVHEEIKGLPEGVRAEVISEDQDIRAVGYQVLLTDDRQMHQTLRPSDDAETILLIGRRGYLRVKALDWKGLDTKSRSVEGVRLQFDYKLPPDVTPPG